MRVIKIAKTTHSAFKLAVAILAVILGLLPALCFSQDNSVAEANKAIVKKAFKIIGAGEYDKMDAIFADNYVRHCQATPEVNVRSLSDFKEYLRGNKAAFPDEQFELLKIVADGDHVAFWATFRGTQTGQMGSFPPTNKSAELDFAGMHRLENGKIVESWLTWDNMTILTQLGHFPPKHE